MSRQAKWVGFLAGGALTLTISGIFDHFLGQNSSVVFLIAAMLIAACIQVFQKRRIKQSILQIADDDDRAVRFEGSAADTQKAIAIGGELGWNVSTLPWSWLEWHAVRFTPGAKGASSKALVQAFIDAGLAAKVRP